MLMVCIYCKINIKTRLIYFDIASSSEYLISIFKKKRLFYIHINQWTLHHRTIQGNSSAISLHHFSTVIQMDIRLSSWLHTAQVPIIFCHKYSITGLISYSDDNAISKYVNLVFIYISHYMPTMSIRLLILLSLSTMLKTTIAYLQAISRIPFWPANLSLLDKQYYFDI